MQRYERFYMWAAMLALMLWSGSALAITGKLTGRVIDQDGNPLPGANIVMTGTQRGATADINGEYLILSLHPGVYEVEASLVGFDRQRKTGVQIRMDFTTTVDFQLTETTLEASEIVVVAQRPPVEPDKTMSKYTISSEDIELAPMVRSVQNIVELQGGVSLDGEVSIRGGDRDDSSYYMDGVRISYRDSRQGGDTFRQVNTSAIQELTVLTGGMGAEYGNAMAGVVSLVTRDGGQSYDGRMEYQFRPAGKKHWGPNVFEDQALHKGRLQWDNPDWVNELDPETGNLVHVQQDYTNRVGHLVEASLSGPLMRDLTFFASTRYTRQAPTLPASHTHTRFNTQNTLKLTHSPTPNLKIRAGGLYYRAKDWNRGSGIVADVKGLDDSGRNLFLPEGYSASGTQIDTEDMQYISMTHILSPRTFYEAKFFRSSTQVDTADVPTVSTEIRRDADGWFNLPRQINWYNLENRRRYGLQFDFSTQYSRGHFIKTGFEMLIGRVWTLEVAEPSAAERRISFMGDGWWEKPHTPVELSLYLQDKMEFEGLIINAGVRYDRMWIREDLPMWFQYGASPMYFTFLKSRDIPTEPMPAIQAIAPRLGISHPITAQSVFRFSYGKYFQMPILWSLLAQEWGTNRGDIDLNGNGVIDPAEQYNSYGSVRGAATVAGARLVHGNMRLKPEETTSFEVGLDWNFAFDYIFGLTTYYRSVKEKPGSGGSGSWAWSDPSGISVSQPTETWTRRDYQDVRGFEIMFRKPFSHHFSFQLAFNVQWASRGNTTTTPSNPMPDSNFVAGGYYWNSWTTSADGGEIPESLTEKAVREGRDSNYYIELYGQAANQTLRNYEQARRSAGEDFWIDNDLSDPEKGLWVYRTSSASYESSGQLGRDRRNYGSVTFLFASPNEFGPGMRGMYPLGNLRLNLIYKIYTGTPYLYTPPAGAQEWRYRPLHTLADLSAEKIFPGMEMRPTLFVEVYNLFNQKDNNTVGPNNQEYIRWGLNMPLPDDPDYLKWGDPSARTRYLESPRELRMGLRLFF